jgi:hypothetical protein
MEYRLYSSLKTGADRLVKRMSLTDLVKPKEAFSA